MKISSISSGGTGHMHAPHNAGDSLLTALQHALHTFVITLDRMGTAIALGEAGDLDGAQALRKKHAE